MIAPSLRKCSRPVLAVILGAILSAPIAAQDLKGGLEAYRRGDYESALRDLRPFADQDDAVAQYILGFMYDTGQGVPQDFVEALKWYQQAAEQGLPEAQARAGIKLLLGQSGRHYDVAEAIRWLRLAAEGGDVEGQMWLGLMYKDGIGVLQDYVEAHKWANLAAAGSGIWALASKEIRSGLETEMTTTQIAEAQRLAREWQIQHPL